MSKVEIPFSPEEAAHLHQTGHAAKLHGNIDGRLVKAAVFGAADGIVTTFAVVAGVAGAGLAPAIVLILGFANLVGDSLSMGIGDFLGERSEQRYKKYQLAVEKWEIKNIPDEERKELKTFFEKRGVSGKDSKTIVNVVAKHPELWAELGFIEEMGEIPDEAPRMWESGVVTMVAFVLAGALPLTPYVIELFGFSMTYQQQFIFSTLATGGALFLVGSLRTHITKGKWWMNGLEMLGIGAVAAVGAYITGAIVKTVAGGLI